MSPLSCCDGLARRLTPRRATLALGVIAALALAPAAHADPTTTDATGTVASGGLLVTAPTITFGATLTGVDQQVPANVGAWSIDDATGSDAGYTVSVSATAPTVSGDGSNPTAGTNFAMVWDPPAATVDPDNSFLGTGPTASQVTLGTTAQTLETAATGDGVGKWNIPSDSGGSFMVTIPGDASAGTYSSTLTFTATENADPS